MNERYCNENPVRDYLVSLKISLWAGVLFPLFLEAHNLKLVDLCVIMASRLLKTTIFLKDYIKFI
jgi:hypothetical protein